MADSKNSKDFAFVVYPGVRTLDLAGSYTILYNLTLSAGYRAPVVAARLGPLETDTPLQLIPDKTFEQVPHPAALMVLGGGEPALPALEDKALLNYVRRAAEGAQVVGAIDSGTLLLAAAGLLEGKRATTHWAFSERLQKLGACYVREPWVEEGKFITAAGVSGAMDMALYLLAKIRDQGTARFMQTMAEYDPEPPLGPIGWSRVDGKTEEARDADS